MESNNEFNKVKALDELSKILSIPPNSTISETICSLVRAQDYLKKIHDSAFLIGFEKGIDSFNERKDASN